MGYKEVVVFRNRSPGAAGVLTFVLIMAAMSFMVIVLVVFDNLQDPFFPAFVYQFLVFFENFGFWLAVGAGVIVYFWKRGQEE